MTKLQTVRNLNDSAHQLDAVKTARQLQQTLIDMNLPMQAQQAIDQLASVVEPLAQALASLTDESRAEINNAGKAATRAAKLQDAAATKLTKQTDRLEKKVTAMQAKADTLIQASNDLANAKRPSMWFPMLCAIVTTAAVTSAFWIWLGRL